MYALQYASNKQVHNAIQTFQATKLNRTVSENLQVFARDYLRHFRIEVELSYLFEVDVKLI